MPVAPFGTLKLARALRDRANFTPEQAEGAADAIAEAVQNDLATRADVVDAELDVRHDRFQTIVIFGAIIAFMRLVKP
jgi:hypothetical protein